MNKARTALIYRSLDSRDRQALRWKWEASLKSEIVHCLIFFSSWSAPIFTLPVSYFDTAFFPGEKGI